MVSRHDLERRLWVWRLKWQALSESQRRQFIIFPCAFIVFIGIGVLAFWPGKDNSLPPRPTAAAPRPQAPLDTTPVPDPVTDRAQLDQLSDSALRAEHERRSRMYAALLKNGSEKEKLKAWDDMGRVNEVMAEREAKRRAEAVAPKAPPPKPPPRAPVFPR